MRFFPAVSKKSISRLVIEGRRVRQVDDDLRTFERFGKTFTSDCVDAGIGRRCKCLMPELGQLAHDLRTDQSSSSDYYDFINFALLLNSSPSAYKQNVVMGQSRMSDNFHLELSHSVTRFHKDLDW